MDRSRFPSEPDAIRVARGSGGAVGVSDPGSPSAGRRDGTGRLRDGGGPSSGQTAICLEDLRARLARGCSAVSSGAGGVRGDVEAALAPLLSGPLIGRGRLGDADDADMMWCTQQIQSAINTLEGARSALAGEMSQRRLHARRGEASVAETLANITSVSGAAARRVERDAEALAAQPRVAVVLDSGDINVEQAAAIAKADVPGGVRDELCDAAKAQTADETAESVRAAEAAARRETDADRCARQRAARRAWMRFDRREGMWHLGAKFDPLTGDAINRQLAKLIQRHWQSDKHLPDAQRRTVPQRAADALARMLLPGSSGPDAAERPAPGSGGCSDGDGPDPDTSTVSALASAGTTGRSNAGDEAWLAPPATQMIVIATLDNLRSASSGPAAITDAGTELSAAELRKLACDAQVIPAVMGGAGEILDVGRARRTISPALRRALIARDQKCVWPRCDRPPLDCDGHHIDHWANDGPTCIDNLALLCHTHHIRLHELDLVLVRPSVPSAPGEGWTVTPAPAQHTRADRTPVSDHTRQDR